MSFGIKIFVFTCCVSFALGLCGQGFREIGKELNEIVENSLKLRSQVRPTIISYGIESPQKDSLDRLIFEFDSVALIRVEAIIKSHGWLGKSKVGEKANLALFISIQHAANPLIRKKYFPLLKISAEKGESDPSVMATMHDRILVERGKEQLYGTQTHFVDEQRHWFPIGDIGNLNKRRRKVGLKKIRIDLPISPPLLFK